MHRTDYDFDVIAGPAAPPAPTKPVPPAPDALLDPDKAPRENHTA